MKKLVVCFGAVLVAVAVYFMGRSMTDAPSAAAAPPSAEIHWICRETGELSRGPRGEAPAVNPRTGRATLVQALYCRRCNKWYPAPPEAVRERMPAGPQCPAHPAERLWESDQPPAGPKGGEP